MKNEIKEIVHEYLDILEDALVETIHAIVVGQREEIKNKIIKHYTKHCYDCEHCYYDNVTNCYRCKLKKGYRLNSVTPCGDFYEHKK